MASSTTLLMATAFSVAFLHTLAGPDHYVPFIALARSGRWSLRKTTLVTCLCGLGHILSSVVLGLVGVALGVAVARLKIIEVMRGGIAAWALIGFGLVYFAWGLRRAIRNRPHEHVHVHGSGPHSHTHVHSREHLHTHESPAVNKTTPWVLFLIFVFGPCEPLIPLLMFPAAKGNATGAVIVAGVFGLTTIATMLGIVLLTTFGISLLPTAKLERYSHALAGAAILLCGLTIQLLGL
jgi:nickel/cobalt transporter (NicO) family protein